MGKNVPTSKSELIAVNMTDLDGENSAEVIGLLRSLNEKRGVTVLMVTHNEEIARGAGRLITIAHGKITGDIRNV